MSETVLAALIAAGATILTSFLQLRLSLTRESEPRSQSSSSRRKSKLPLMMLSVLAIASGVGGFALSQWFTDHQRLTQNELRTELQARITELSRTTGELKQTRLDTRAEVETDVLRRIGGRGVMALATVAPCHTMAAPASVAASTASPSTGSAITGSAPPSAAPGPTAPSASAPAAPPISPSASASPATGSPAAAPAQGGAGLASATSVPDASAPGAVSSAPAQPASVCTEVQATEVTLCVPIPQSAVVSRVDLFTRYVDSDIPWNESHVNAGQEVEQARFSEKVTEAAADDGTRHVCHTFTNWSTQRARAARMIVRYAIPTESSEPQSEVRHEGLPATIGALAIR